MTDDQNTVILDYTSKGIFWDTSKNLWVYAFSAEKQTLTAIHPTDTPTSWFSFSGYWGDQEYESQDPRQGTVCNQVKWGDGPTFVIRKNLNRVKVSHLIGSQGIG